MNATQMEAQIEALQTELDNAPEWKQETTWYSDREEELAYLKRTLKRMQINQK